MGIHLQEVSYTYQAGTPFEGRALFGVDLEIVDGSLYCIDWAYRFWEINYFATFKWIKYPTSGSVIVDDMVINATSR